VALRRVMVRSLPQFLEVIESAQAGGAQSLWYRGCGSDKDKVGMAGGEYGVRGFIDAYDAKSGQRAWRFWTVPAAGERGSETWTGDSLKNGAATAAEQFAWRRLGSY
jgi:hypothetical protein